VCKDDATWQVRKTVAAACPRVQGGGPTSAPPLPPPALVSGTLQPAQIIVRAPARDAPWRQPVAVERERVLKAPLALGIVQC
jgi:hypothetical protein